MARAPATPGQTTESLCIAVPPARPAYARRGDARCRAELIPLRTARQSPLRVGALPPARLSAHNPWRGRRPSGRRTAPEPSLRDARVALREYYRSCEAADDRDSVSSSDQGELPI